MNESGFDASLVLIFCMCGCAALLFLFIFVRLVRLGFTVSVLYDNINIGCSKPCTDN